MYDGTDGTGGVPDDQAQADQAEDQKVIDLIAKKRQLAAELAELEEEQERLSIQPTPTDEDWDRIQDHPPIFNPASTNGERIVNETVAKVSQMRDQAHQQAEPDWDAMNAQIVTRKRAQDSRKERSEGVFFELPVTGGFARVRMLNLADANALTWIPNELVETFVRVANEIEGQEKIKSKAVLNSAAAFKSLTQRIADANRLADAFCVYGFIKPTLTATQEEADQANSDSVMWVEELDIDERMAYMEQCFAGSDMQGARILDPFRRKRLSDASHKQGNQAAAKA